MGSCLRESVCIPTHSIPQLYAKPSSKATPSSITAPSRMATINEHCLMACISFANTVASAFSTAAPFFTSSVNPDVECLVKSLSMGSFSWLISKWVVYFCSIIWDRVGIKDFVDDNNKRNPFTASIGTSRLASACTSVVLLDFSGVIK